MLLCGEPKLIFGVVTGWLLLWGLLGTQSPYEKVGFISGKESLEK